MFQGTGCIMQLPINLHTDTMRIYHSVTSKNNMSTAHKIAEQVRYALRTLEDAFERALTREAGLHLAKGAYLGRSPQVMQVSTSASCHHYRLNGCIHQFNVRDSEARSNTCWRSYLDQLYTDN